MEGKKFNRLKAIKEAGRNKEGRILWECVCDCGNTATVLGKCLRSGRIKSCGCIHKERAMQHVVRNTKPIGFERIHNRNGYVLIKTESGFVRKNIYVMEQHIGRRLLPGEVVHHIDGNKKNNDISNLRLMTNGEHTSHHHTGLKYTEKRRINHLESVRKQKHIRLSISLVEQIKKRVANGESQRSIAISLCVSPMTISNAVRGKTWKLCPQ